MGKTIPHSRNNSKIQSNNRRNRCYIDTSKTHIHTQMSMDIYPFM